MLNGHGHGHGFEGWNVECVAHGGGAVIVFMVFLWICLCVV